MHIPPENAQYGLVNSIQNAAVLVFKRNCLVLCILFSGGLLLSTVPRGPLSLLEHYCSRFFSSAVQDSKRVALTVIEPFPLQAGLLGHLYFSANTGKAVLAVCSSPNGSLPSRV